MFLKAMDKRGVRMNRYRFRRSKLPAALAALLILAIAAAAIIMLPKIIKEDTPPDIAVNTPELTPELTPAPTPEPSPRPAYIPSLSELTAIPSYENIEFTDGFTSAEFDDEGVLAISWQPSEDADYYLLCILDDNNCILRKEILWADAIGWNFGVFEGTGIMLLGYKDMGQDAMDDDVIVAAYSEKIEPFDPEPSVVKDYYIIVDKEDCTFAIYEYEQKTGDFTKLIDQFPCALGGASTPSGIFEIGEKGEWKTWTDEQYSPYHARFARSGGRNLYFHGPVYTVKKRFDTLSAGSYDNIGRSNQTHGCIRTTVAGAKFIYDYCKPGTVVEIVKSSERVTKVIRPDRDSKYPKWDPTDPNKPVS